MGGHNPSVRSTPFCTNPCAVWSSAVAQHGGAAGKCLLGRGGEGRQAPTGGHPARLRRLGAEPRLPGLHGEPPAGTVPSRSPLLGHWPPGHPSAQQGRRRRALAFACCEFLSSPPQPPEATSVLCKDRSEQDASTRPPDSGSRATRALWGRLGLAPSPLLRFVNHVSSSSEKVLLRCLLPSSL